MTASNRRWFRYSLRMLFMVVTVVAVFLAYHVNWIRQRHKFLADEVAAYKLHHPTRDPWPVSPFRVPVAMRARRAPGALWLFGEEGFPGVAVLADAHRGEQLSDHDWERIRLARRLFPEAGVSTIHVLDTPLLYDVHIASPPD